MAEADPRIYQRRDVVSFRKTNEAFGGLSNMAPGYPLRVLGVRIATAEALYQACRFPHMPEVQELIIAQTSPMTAKMRSKPYRNDSRSDWDAVRIPIMKWCLRVKLAQNWSKFGSLLLETGDRPIVEDSRKDDFWGAMPGEDGVLRGRNVLGRLLMELREKLRNEPAALDTVLPVPIVDFTLFSREIPSVVRLVSRDDFPIQADVQVVPVLLDLFKPGKPDSESREEIASPQPEIGATPTDFATAPSEVEYGSPRKVGHYMIWAAAGAVLLAGLFWLVAT